MAGFEADCDENYFRYLSRFACCTIVNWTLFQFAQSLTSVFMYSNQMQLRFCRLRLIINYTFCTMFNQLWPFIKMCSRILVQQVSLHCNETIIESQLPRINLSAAKAENYDKFLTPIAVCELIRTFLPLFIIDSFNNFSNYLKLSH